MRKILLCFIAMAAMTSFFSCQQKSDGLCHIEGVVNGEQYEGKRIFVVPMFGPKTAEYVDSMEITNGKFSFTKDFTKDTMQMYKILLDYHYRFGLQPLLIVGEPGTIRITIDSISHATGTPQNDSLEKWKVQTEIHNLQLGRMRKNITELQKTGDTAQANYIKQRADSFHLVYKNNTRRMAKNLEGSVLGNFLKTMYPMTYKKKMSDGRIVTMNADTNEEIPE